jgi:hypothetical protein
MQVDKIEPLPHIGALPLFYRDVMKSWIRCGGGHVKQPTTYYDIRQQVLWGNKHITFKGKSLVFKNWIDSKIITVNDLIDKYGHISEASILSKLQ